MALTEERIRNILGGVTSDASSPEDMDLAFSRAIESAATAPLRARIAELEAENHNLNWALGTEGFDQMATPEEQAEHEKGHAEAMANIARMKAHKERHDQLEPEGVDYLDHIAALTAQVEQAAQPVAEVFAVFDPLTERWMVDVRLTPTEHREQRLSAGTPLYTSPPKAVPLTEAQREVLAYLDGTGPLDGIWYGDKHPTEQGAYWWRKRLWAAFDTPATVEKG